LARIYSRMTKLFISHSSQDDDFVRHLRAILSDHGQPGWIDSRELHGGDPLWPEIERAIEAASAYAIVVSPAALQSTWVGKELQYALNLANQRGRDKFPIVPLALNGTKLGVLEVIFGEAPLYIPVSSDAGGIEAAMHAILVALGKRLPTDVPFTAPRKPQPLEDLVLELTDLKFHEQDGKRRASARARLVYEPAIPGQPHVHSAHTWRFIAPLGPIEAEELRWYLEKYAIWPSRYFRDRARKVEENLAKWGQLLHQAAMPSAHTTNVMNAWAKIDKHAGRRFSVHVDTAPEADAPEADIKAAQEAGTELLKAPWELLHDGVSYLFQGATPTRVRRRLPNTRALEVPVVATPIRILLVTARPEDDACSYIDHRASALPLIEAMESLPGLVNTHVLSPPTLPRLRAELDRARENHTPYHVIHFDGHGVYNTQIGLGGLCFELPEDTGKLEKRRHITIYTKDSTDYGIGLESLLRDHRIPLVFLEACQTAQAEKASESIASELLKLGVASVIAMSHSVLVETARRFVEAFYQALAAGNRVGDAMLAGQRQLKDDTFRGRIFGAGELRLEDWFVPVLFQEKDDPQLFSGTPARQTLADFQTALRARLGELPPVPETGFIGRSRELLALQRLLRHERYAALRGQGGEGKTALAAEFARWMVRSHQIHRAAFVSVETHSNHRAVVDTLGRQLIGKDFSATGDLEEAIQQVERALREQATLLVIDNMESILLPPWLETPEALSEDARRELEAILTLCSRLNAEGDTRLLFTSREVLPAPFALERHRRELSSMDTADAVKFIERVLNVAGRDAGASNDAAREEIETLVGAVHCHARTLALLAPALQTQGVSATRQLLDQLMAQMEKSFPGSREKSVFASVELSLRRLSQANRERARVLGVFHGAVDLDMLRVMMQWDEADVQSLASELIKTGLATPNPYNHRTLNPALSPYLRGRMDAADRAALTDRWVQAMKTYVTLLYGQQTERTEMAAQLTLLELPNLFALLDLVQRAGNAVETIDLATSLYGLLQNLGKPRLLERVGQVRDAAAAALGDASHYARFDAEHSRIEQQIDSGQLQEALVGAQQLLQKARTTGDRAYDGADYALASACSLMGRVLRMAGSAEHALPLLEEAQLRFETVAKQRHSPAAQTMASVCFADRGDCLVELGRLNEATSAYEENIRRAEQLGDARQVAIGKFHLGTAHIRQRRYPEALAAYAAARERFTQLNEPGSVATVWHQTGMAYQSANNPEAAEDAYRKALAIKVRLGNVADQASTLGQLGNFYNTVDRLEDAVAIYRQAADKYVAIHHMSGESRTRNNLAGTLCRLQRFDEARHEILRSIECGTQFGHAVEPWLSWGLLARIETSSGNPAAAAAARTKALASYLAYRRAGGENHTTTGRLTAAVIKSLRERGTDAALSLLQQLTTTPEFTHLAPFIRALEAIIAGNRDHTIADDPNLDYRLAAELLLLIETLEASP
jgi:tetratricopeptide (TPR) repeat protein